jgi:hypothetical protein
MQKNSSTCVEGSCTQNEIYPEQISGRFMKMSEVVGVEIAGLFYTFSHRSFIK